MKHKHRFELLIQLRKTFRLILETFARKYIGGSYYWNVIFEKDKRVNLVTLMWKVIKIRETDCDEMFSFTQK